MSLALREAVGEDTLTSSIPRVKSRHRSPSFLHVLIAAFGALIQQANTITSAMAARHLRRLSLSLGYASAASVVVGATMYFVYRPRDLPGQFPSREAAGLGSPNFPQVKSRMEQIARLKASAGVAFDKVDKQIPNTALVGAYEAGGSDHNEVFDLLVVGGGATGTGIALDAASRGLKVALVEKDDFAAGTSSKSTKLVHGGVRYLEKAVWQLDYNQYKLVIEGLRERQYFLHTAPHLSSWLPIMIPIEKWWQIPYFWVGTKVYDLLAGPHNIESSYFLTRSRALDAFPMLKKDTLCGALVYYDGAHNDSRMNISLAVTAALYGATIANYIEVTGVEKDTTGRLCGVKVRDLLAEKDGKLAVEFSIKAKGIINATGPFTDSIRKMDDPDTEEIVAPSSGVHIMLPGYYSPAHMGLLNPSTSDGRVIFFLPWLGNTIAGTTDAPCQIQPDLIAKEEEIDWILTEVRNYLQPKIDIRRQDVLAAWSGIRPLVRDPNKAKSEGLVRNHLVTTSPSGLVTISGGKWTTYRQMAEEAVDTAIEEFNLKPQPVPNPPLISGLKHYEEVELDGKCKTPDIRLIGAHGYSKILFIHLIQHFGLDTEVAKHLTTAYGDRAWVVAALSTVINGHSLTHGKRISPLYPFVDGEIRYAVRHEYAQTAIDVIARRTRLAFLDAQAALEALPQIVDIMAEELNWSEPRKEREWSDTVIFLGSMGLPKSKLGVSRADMKEELGS